MSSHRYALIYLKQLLRPVKDEASFWQGRVMRILRRIMRGLLICVILLGLFGGFAMQFLDNYGQEGTYFLLATGAFALSVSLLCVLFFLLALFGLLKKSLEKDRDRRADERAVQVEPRWGKRSTEDKSDTVDLKGRAKRVGIVFLVGAVIFLPFIAGAYFSGRAFFDVIEGPRVESAVLCLDVTSERGKIGGGRYNPVPRREYKEYIYTLQIPDQDVTTLRARVAEGYSDPTIPETIADMCTASTPFTLTYYAHSSIILDATDPRESGEKTP
ncbi:MAG: hypothetical protein Q4C87_06170 [Actinomycetaceae bacterium]|nr:hypothetical protein [Actinomycetaceae bacterium]